ncbi:hypothetical protein V2A60_001728 [Cordyceps javanica]
MTPSTTRSKGRIDGAEDAVDDTYVGAEVLRSEDGAGNDEHFGDMPVSGDVLKLDAASKGPTNTGV